MLNSFFPAVTAFVGTKLDDIFLLMLFFSQCTARRQKTNVILGQYLGITVLVLISLLAASGLQLIPQGWLRLLGLLPTALGIRAWLQRSGEDAEVSSVKAGSVALVTIANGGDNLGVYIPLFSGFSFGQRMICAAVFALMTALWCFLGARLAGLPSLNRFLRKYRTVIVPVVLILLGLYILSGI